MLATRKINNNVVVCTDDDGTEPVAMGKGIGFGQIPREIPLSEIERTFYDVKPRLAEMMTTVSPEVTEIALRVTKIAQNRLPYRIAPNACSRSRTTFSSRWTAWRRACGSTCLSPTTWSRTTRRSIGSGATRSSSCTTGSA